METAAATQLPALRYLSGEAVRTSMPPVRERIELARRTMIALVKDAEMPPKLGVEPRPSSAHTAAMPALLRGPEPDGTTDLLGMKWVTAFPTNRALGLPAIHATVVLNDALTGTPLAILDGGPITAERTAAVSGVALQAWWPQIQGDGRPVAVTLVGGGVQGASHVAVLAAVAEGAVLTICDRHPDRAARLADVARNAGRFESVNSTTDMPAAVRGADIVLTMISFAQDRQILPADTLSGVSLVIAVDYDMCIPAETARRSSLFLSDDVEQLMATRRGNVFAGYPDPDASLGEALLGNAPSLRADGPIYVNHLGVGLADVVFADAICRRALASGAGVELER
jgi:ornithine cyclodeaminase/alanine dehydrogenase-like protein (mu-crystallin family)